VKRLLCALLWLLPIAAFAQDTNNYCVVCGRGPLTSIHHYQNRWGAICEECNGLPNHCANCDLPIRDGEGAVKTADGRLVCKFCKPLSVFDMNEAREMFAVTRQELVGIYGSRFVLKCPDVVVNLYDVDQWSKGKVNGADMYGYAQTVPFPGGTFKHQVLLRVGMLRVNLTKQAAHEYTHLWINENLPARHVIDPDTLEAICELSAYKLMESQSQSDELKRILRNPYTNGKIKRLVEVESEKGAGFILDWIKNSTAPDFDSPEQSLPERKPLTSTKSEAVMSPAPVQAQRDSFETIRLKDGRTLVGAIKMRIGTTVVIKTKDGKDLEINSSEIVSSVPR
jgi:hypothetical protein